MGKVFLTPDESATRAVEKQVCALLLLYGEKDLVTEIGLEERFVAARLRDLSAFRDRLRALLAEHDLLPGTASPERAQFRFLIDRLRGLFKDQPFEMAISEERKLVELCDELRQIHPQLTDVVKAGREQSLQAAKALERR